MSKVGRNDPCPCGSGKKFKKCCELKKHLSVFEKKEIKQLSSSGAGSLFKKTFSKEKEEPKADIEKKD